MMHILIGTLLVLWSFDVCASYYQSGFVFPVYSHWKTMHPDKLRVFNHGQKSFGVSLNPLVETQFAKPLLLSKDGSHICVFDVHKLKDLEDLFDAGCRIIGTHVDRREVIREAKLKDMTVICSGGVVSDYNNAVMLNVDGFRVVHDKPLQHKTASEFVDKIRLANQHLEIPLFVSPELEGDHLERIAALDGMVNFIMTFHMSDEDYQTRSSLLLSQINERLRKAYLELKIKDDLHSSCL